MVEGKYLDIKAGAFRPRDLLQPVEGAPASPLLTDLGQPISVGGINQFLLFKALHLLITGIQQKPAPEAYLGYALYDADSNMYDQGRIVLSKKARNRHEELKTRIFVPRDGYIEAYVVNESDEDVWFDQFRILSTGPVIVQETHYDPWGVELQGLGYQQGGLKVNKYLYNGKEFNDHLGLNLFDYGARMYDASVGRWFTVDPLEEKFTEWSPYNFVMNNPLRLVDPDGMAPEDIILRGKNNSSLTIKTDIVDISLDVSSLGIDFGGNHTLAGNDVLEAALDIGGLVDQSGIIDGAAAIYHGNNGDWGNAIISGLSVAPGGDLLKLGKVPKHMKTIEKAIEAVQDAKQIKNLRQSAVRNAWKQEKALVESGAEGTRNWTKAELKELKAKGKVKGYQGHHINNVKHHPEHAGNPNNIEFVNKKEHLQRHNGNYRNKSTGEMKNRNTNQ